MRANRIISFLLLLISLKGFAQTGEKSFKIKSENQPSSLFLFTAGYRLPLNKNKILNSGHGLYLEAGINPGKFISKNLVWGIYAGWGWMDRVWSTSFHPEFARDYRSAIINSDRSYLSRDSAIINSSADLIATKKGRDLTLPGCEMNSFHNYSLYYGTIIKLPVKYTPTVKIYMGFTRSHYQEHGNIATKRKDYNIFQLRRQLFGVEVVIFSGFKLSDKKNLNKNLGVVSVYYESHDFYNSSLYFDDGSYSKEIALHKFTTSSFLKKYKREINFGFKFAFSIL